MHECEKRVTIRIPCVLHTKLIRVAEEKGYKTLSELIRELIRDAIERYEARAEAAPTA